MAAAGRCCGQRVGKEPFQSSLKSRVARYPEDEKMTSDSEAQEKSDPTRSHPLLYEALCTLVGAGAKAEEKTDEQKAPVFRNYQLDRFGNRVYFSDGEITVTTKEGQVVSERVNSAQAQWGVKIPIPAGTQGTVNYWNGSRVAQVRGNLESETENFYFFRSVYTNALHEIRKECVRMFEPDSNRKPSHGSGATKT